jgi:hypothetical protein
MKTCDEVGPGSIGRIQQGTNGERKTFVVVVAAVATFIGGCENHAATETPRTTESAQSDSLSDQGDEANTLYTVADFDPGADPSKDLVATVAQAS